MSWAKSSNGNRRRADELAAFLGLSGAGIAAPDAGARPAPAPSRSHRSLADSPPAWRDYGMRLVGQLQLILAADRDLAGDIAGGIGDTPGAGPTAAGVRLWVSPDGRVERLALDDHSDDLAEAIRALLRECDVGPPPPGMPQPVRFRLSLTDMRRWEKMH